MFTCWKILKSHKGLSTQYSYSSGVTTMGSDRANPGAPNLNGPNGGPQAQAVEQKQWPGPRICLNVVFWPSEFCKISPQNRGNGISESLDSKIFRMNMPWTPRKLVHIRRSTRAFGTSTRGWGLSKILNRGPLDITLRHWVIVVRTAIFTQPWNAYC
jgi:hypothetical protein